MSRSNYTDGSDDNWGMICYRGSVASAIRGNRGQALLREMLEALDAMPDKKLVPDSLVTADGQYCALGALGAKRGLDMSKINPEDYDQVAAVFGVAPTLIREIVFENDDDFSYSPDTDEENSKRWRHMRNWVVKNIKVQP